MGLVRACTVGHGESCQASRSHRNQLAGPIPIARRDLLGTHIATVANLNNRHSIDAAGSDTRV